MNKFMKYVYDIIVIKGIVVELKVSFHVLHITKMHSLLKTFFSILHVHKIMLERIRRGMLN